MQEINCIQLSQTDYPAISCLAILSTPTFGLQNSHNTLLLSSVAEHNLPGVVEKAGSEAELFLERRFRREGFMLNFITDTNGKVLFFKQSI